MSFYSKGDFKIEQSWGNSKPQPERNNKSRASQRRQSNQNESLMRQLAEGITEPSTDLIDDSLSKLLMKERGQQYASVKPKKQLTIPLQKKATERPIESPQDSDLVSSMANRLQKLQKTCQSQRMQIKQQKDALEKVKTQNAFLKGMKQDSSKAYSEMQELKKRNQQLQSKVIEMQNYLKQHGLKWVGNKLQGKLNEKQIKKQIADAKHPYRLPSEIDITSIRRRVADLNAGLDAQGAGTEIYNDKGVHKFKKAENLPLGFYSNGIAVKGYNFYPYKSKDSLKILADLLDGYFPYIFKAKYPNGVFLQVVDHIEQVYVQQKKQQSINTFNTNKDFEPMSKEQFLNKLPNQIIKNGKVIPVRGEIQKMFNGGNPSNERQKSNNQNTHIVEVDGVIEIKSNCWQKIKAGRLSADEACTLKIRNQKGAVYLLKMNKNDKVIDVIGELRKLVRGKFNLLANFPKRSFTGDEEQNLEQLGFYPNQNLQIQEIKL